MHHQSTPLATPSESNISDSISFLQQYLNSTNRRSGQKPHHVDVQHRMMGSGGGPARQDPSSSLSPSAKDRGGRRVDDQRLPRYPESRAFSERSSRSASAGSAAPLHPHGPPPLDWRHAIPQREGGGWTPRESRQPSPPSRLPSARGEGRRLYGNASSASSAVGVGAGGAHSRRGSGAYREGSCIPRIRPVSLTGRFRNTSFHDEHYDRPRHDAITPTSRDIDVGHRHRRPDAWRRSAVREESNAVSPLRAPSTLSTSWRRPSPEHVRRDPSAYEPVSSSLADPSSAHVRRDSSSTQQPAMPRQAREATDRVGSPAESPPRRSAPPPPSQRPAPPQVPLQEPRSVPLSMPGNTLNSSAISGNPHLSTAFPFSGNHAENLRTLSLYLKHYYAREVEEDQRGLETLLPEDILGLAQCFYVDLYRLVREDRRQAGLAVTMFSPGDPGVGDVAALAQREGAGDEGPRPAGGASPRTPPAVASQPRNERPARLSQSSERSRRSRREHSASATATYTGNRDAELSDEEDVDEVMALRQGERKVIEAVAKEIIRSIATTPERQRSAQDRKSRDASAHRGRVLQSPRRETGSDGEGDAAEERATGRRGVNEAEYVADLPSGPGPAAAYRTPPRTPTGGNGAASHHGDASAGAGSDGSGRTPRKVQVVQARVPTFVRPFSGAAGEMGNLHNTSSVMPGQYADSLPAAAMETQVYADDEVDRGRGAGAHSPTSRAQHQQRMLLAGLPNSPYGSRKILAEADSNSGRYPSGAAALSGAGGPVDESTLAFLHGTPSRSPRRLHPTASGNRSGRRPPSHAVGPRESNDASPSRHRLDKSRDSPARRPSPSSARRPEPHSGILKRPLKSLMPLLRRGAGLVKFISHTRRPHLRFFLVQDCLDTFQGRQVMMPHLTWRAIPSDSSAAEMTARAMAVKADVSSSSLNADGLSGDRRKRRASFLADFEAALNLIDLQGVRVGPSSSPELFRRRKRGDRPLEAGRLPPVVDHEGRPLSDSMCAVLVFKTRTLGLGFLTEEERQVWVGAMMGVVERNKTLGV